jgi:hypothetical protein
LQALVFLKQGFFGLYVLRMNGNAGHRADLHTLGFIKVAHALCALGGIYFVNFWAEVDGLIGTFRFAHITIDAFIGDHQGHKFLTKSD